MWIFLIMSCAQDDCPPNAIPAPDGSCIINSNSQTQDTAKADSGEPETDSPLTWQTLAEGCVATTDGIDPISETSALFVQDYVFAEIIDIEVDVNHDALWAVGEGGLMAFDLSEPTSPTYT